jgi:hypothetical protein
MKHQLILSIILLVGSVASDPLGPILLPSAYTIADYSGQSPLPARTGAIFRAINNTHAIYSGGFFEAVALTLFGQNTSLYYSDTYILDATDPQNIVWTRVNTSGPSARGYTCNFFDPVGQKLYVHGGTAVNAQNNPYIAFNDTWSFDVSTLSWSQVFTSTVPRSRSAMSCDYAQGAGWMFGGTFPDPVTFFVDTNELWRFDITTQNWVLVQASNDSDPSRPDSRDQHYFVTRPGTSQILLYSGQKLRITILPVPPFFVFSAIPIGELWVYDTITGVWTVLDNSTAPIPHRRESVLFLNSRFFLSQNGDLPLNQPPFNNSNYRCCGQIFNSVNPTNDVYIYDMVQQKWFEVEWLTNPPKTRRSDIVKLGNHVYLTGGNNYLPLQIVDPNSNDPNAGKPVGAILNGETYKIRLFWPYV